MESAMPTPAAEPSAERMPSAPTPATATVPTTAVTPASIHALVLLDAPNTLLSPEGPSRSTTCESMPRRTPWSSGEVSERAIACGASRAERVAKSLVVRGGTLKP
jgi:hypothetical protein